MNKIIEYSNWCYKDKLDDEFLIDQEKLRIKFPNGETGEHKIKVKKWSVPIMDMYTPYNVPYSKAYIESEIKGVKFEMPIVGLEAERIMEVKGEQSK